MSLLVNLVGLILMALVVWWFWLSHRKSSAQATTQEATIIVEDGVYTPASIRAKSGQSLTPVSYTHLTLPTTPYV